MLPATEMDFRKGLAMPRKPRMYLPGIPSHVIQRGNNRLPCFFAETDYSYYLYCLREATAKYRVAVHAYVLMTNHVHLLMTPTDSTGISSVMQSIGRRYVQYVNYSYRRCGTLWESRHKASLVQAEEYLLACYRYIEMNPVRDGMVNHPGEYHWSSYRHNAYGRPDPVLQPHPLYLQLHNETEKCLNCYRGLFTTDLGSKEVHTIRTTINFSMPLGNDRFNDEIEQALGRRIGHPKRGRPFRKNRDHHDRF